MSHNWIARQNLDLKHNKLLMTTKIRSKYTVFQRKFTCTSSVYHKIPSIRKPKLTYDSMNEYFKEISFNVFLEDQLNNELNIIDSSNFTISWYEDLDKKNNQFQLHIPMRPEIIDKFYRKIEKFKKNPFLVDQAIF